MDHKEFSRRGGLARSAKKTRAVRANARKPRGKWATAVYYKYKSVEQEEREGVLLLPGKTPRGEDAFNKWVEKVIIDDPINKGHDFSELIDFIAKSVMI